jgi:hypothetical protein
MKIGTLTNPGVKAALTKIFKADLQKEVAFKVKRLVISIDAELAKYDSLRNSIIEELANRDDKGAVKKDDQGNVDLSPEKKLEFVKRDRELRDMDILVQTLKLSELGNTVLSGADLFLLEDIVKEG